MLALLFLLTACGPAEDDTDIDSGTDVDTELDDRIPLNNASFEDETLTGWGIRNLDGEGLWRVP